MNKTIIIKPIVTEKSMATTGGSTKYTFEVAQFATKMDIKLAVKQAFQVHVVSVSTSKIKGKRKKIGKRRIEEAASATKKATIMLKKGEKISFVETTDTEVKKKKKDKK